MENKFPVGFYSKKHLTIFLSGILASVGIDVLILILIVNNVLKNSIFVLLFLILIIIEFIVLTKYLTYPMDIVHYDFRKNMDYEKTKAKLEAMIAADTTYETKNYVRVQLLRYATIYEKKYCELLIKDIYLPKVRNEVFLLDYYEALFNYYLITGSHSKCKNILNALTEYKAPKQFYNKLSVLYSLYMKYEVIESELVALNPVDKNPLNKQISLYGYALYYRNNNNIEKYEKYKALVNRISENNTYYTSLEMNK